MISGGTPSLNAGPRFLERAEAMLGIIAALLISVGVIVGVTIICFGHAMRARNFALGLLFYVPPIGMIIPCEWASLRFLLARRDSPSLLQAALNQTRFVVALRPLLAAWWMVHFVLTGIAADWYIVLWRAEARYDLRSIHPLMPYIACFCASLGSNLFLLLAVSSLAGDGRALRIVWRWRVLIDLLAALGRAHG